MKFKCPIAASRFSEVLTERVEEYNEGRNKPHLHLDIISSTAASFELKEGRDRRIAPTVLRCSVSECEDGVEIDSSIVHEPQPRVTDYIYYFIVKLLAWLTLSSVPYLFTAFLLRAAGVSYSLLFSLIVPAFILVFIAVAQIRDMCFVSRRYARFIVAYLGATEIQNMPSLVRKTKKKRNNFAHLRHVAIYHLLRPLAGLYVRLFVGFRPPKRISHDRKFIMVGNHTTDYDMIFMGMAVRQQTYFVMSEHALRGGWASHLLAWAFAPIAKSKGTNSGSAIMNILRHSRQGYNVAIFPEGYRSMHGVTNSFSPATGAMVKKMNCDLITYRIEGGFLAQPMWGSATRRGKVTGKVVRIVPAEQLTSMTAEEVNEIIRQDIHVDYVELQNNEKVPFLPKKGRGLAENVEFALFACPCCQSLGTITSSGDGFSCCCGMTGHIDPYGMLEVSGSEFKNIRDWYYWEEEFIRSVVLRPRTEVLATFTGQDLSEIDETAHTTSVLVADGKTVLTSRGFTVGNYTFLFSEIPYLDAFRKGYMLFTTSDGKYYEVTGAGHYPSLLFKLMWKNRDDAPAADK